jgi:hypothetical protein
VHGRAQELPIYVHVIEIRARSASEMGSLQALFNHVRAVCLDACCTMAVLLTAQCSPHT